MNGDNATTGPEPSLFGVWESNINSILPDDPELSDHAGNNYFRGLLCKVYKVGSSPK